MIRGTTPRHIFTLPDAMADVEFAALYVTYKQHGKTVLEKSLDNINRDGRTISVQLTQTDTLAFKGGIADAAQIQIRLRTTDGTALASNIMRVSVGQILKDGEI